MTRTHDGRTDDGSVLPLVLVYALVGIVLAGVVGDLTQVFVQRRALAAAADGAAVAAAGSLDEAVFYGEGAGETLPLGAVSARVGEYVDAASLASRFTAFRVEGVTTDGAQVTVVLGATTPFPFDPFGLASHEIGATASARSPYAALP